MAHSLRDIISAYRRDAPLAEASTIPSAWYTDERMPDLERRTVFSGSWQVAGRVEQLQRPGQFVAVETPAGEPVVIVRDDDRVLRGFFNVCRHHAAAVVADGEGTAAHLRCPYHGWTYGLDGALKGTPDFAGVCDFDRAVNGLVPVDVDVWERWVFVRIEKDGPPLAQFVGSHLATLFQGLPGDAVSRLQWLERRCYSVDCNWKVFVDNYLDGGYHVPHLHKALDSVLDLATYRIETADRCCIQSSPIVASGDARASDLRSGQRALYVWLYPNLMINCYGDTMDTNVVIPRGPDRTDVIFDYFFADTSESTRARNLESIALSEQIQEEDVGICASVQRGLRSRAYDTGRLSVRREAGEQLFHQLLYDDLISGLSEEGRSG